MNLEERVRLLPDALRSYVASHRAPIVEIVALFANETFLHSITPPISPDAPYWIPRRPLSPGGRSEFSIVIDLERGALSSSLLLTEAEVPGILDAIDRTNALVDVSLDEEYVHIGFDQITTSVIVAAASVLRRADDPDDEGWWAAKRTRVMRMIEESPQLAEFLPDRLAEVVRREQRVIEIVDRNRPIGTAEAYALLDVLLSPVEAVLWLLPEITSQLSIGRARVPRNPLLSQGVRVELPGEIVLTVIWHVERHDHYERSDYDVELVLPRRGRTWRLDEWGPDVWAALGDRAAALDSLSKRPLIPLAAPMGLQARRGDDSGGY